VDYYLAINQLQAWGQNILFNGSSPRPHQRDNTDHYAFDAKKVKS
jgi:hypothetical protein